MTKTDEDARVLAAAAKLFRRQGFSATTVRQIASEARMLPGSLHYRYASKDDVLLALMAKGVQTVRAAVEAAVAQAEDPLERLRLGLRAHLSVLLSDADAVHALLFEWRSLTGAALESTMRLRDTYEQYWDDLLRAALATGKTRAGDDVRLVRLFGFGAINWVATWYRKDGGMTPESIADAFWAFMAFGLVSESARPSNVDELFTALAQADTKKKPAAKRARTGRPHATA